MRNRVGLIGIEYVALYVLFGLVLVFQYSFSFTEEETYLFIVLIAAYVWVVGLMVFARLRFNLHMFEPITIISAIYICIFIVKPIVDLRNEEMFEHGINVISGGVKATALFVLGFTVFYLSYYSRRRQLMFNNTPILKEHPAQEDEQSGELVYNMPLLYIVWAVVFILCLVGLVSQGLSLRYIFSFGAGGERIIDDSNTALLFLSNFGITLVVLWLMILEGGRNTAMKIIITGLCIVYILMRNARWLMLVFIISPIVFRYMKLKKQPKLFWALLVGAVGLLIFAWMQSNRYFLNTGGAMRYWSLKDISLGTLLAPLESDFSTYRTFYSMVNRFPSQHMYMFGTTFLYTFVLFVPRIIWPGKPDNPIRDMIEQSLNGRARASGTSVANIGEFYANFGVIGVVFFMYIFGWVISAVKRSVFSETREVSRDGLILYSIMYPLFFQWVARGNFNGNFYLTLFAVLPFLFRRYMYIRQ